jgi:DNA-binding LacI/PurR family transcriptional regulator
MDQKITIDDVAKEAGVSKGLVSLALNDRPGVSAEAKGRILRVADQLGWRPDPRARGLSTRRAYALGLIVRRSPHVIEVDPFFAAFIAGAEAVLAERGQVLVLSVVPDVDSELDAYRRLSSERRVDGFFVTDLLDDDHRVRALTGLGKPAVVLGRPDDAAGMPVISRDYSAGISKLVGHLAELGHRRIAHVTGNTAMQHARIRLERFLAECRAWGLEPVVEQADFSPEQGAAATRRLLDDPNRPTAVIYGNDPMAIAGMAVAHERGLSLPGDLSIAGMDGSDMGEWVYPTLTSLGNAPSQWGRAAAETLLRLIEEGTAPDVELPGADLIRRASTAAPAGTAHHNTKER